MSVGFVGFLFIHWVLIALLTHLTLVISSYNYTELSLLQPI